MKRGAATRGKVAKLVSGAEAIEIKATIPQKQIRRALALYGLKIDPKEARLIYFFDTPDLALLKTGIVARARRVVGDEHDSTIKFRPVVPDKVGDRWRKYSGFKIEADASEKGVTLSASLTMPVEKGLIKRVAGGDKPIATLFTEEQQLFLLGMASRKIDYSKAVVLGPLLANRWKFEDPACPWPITAELWKREDGATLLEASIKAPVVQAAAATAGFMAFLAEVGAEQDTGQQAKTRWALDYYARKAKTARAPRTKTGKPAKPRRAAAPKAARPGKRT